MQLEGLCVLVGADIIYPIGSLYLCAHCDEDSQALAGGIFNVATRVRGSAYELGERWS
jgi:hypothetical protein